MKKKKTSLNPGRGCTVHRHNEFPGRSCGQHKVSNETTAKAIVRLKEEHDTPTLSCLNLTQL